MVAESVVSGATARAILSAPQLFLPPPSHPCRARPLAPQLPRRKHHGELSRASLRLSAPRPAMT